MFFQLHDCTFNDKNLVEVCGGKESDFHDKSQKMVDDDIKNGIYKVAEDNTLKDLKLLKSFLCINFRKCEGYEKMPPKSNQLGQIYGKAKTKKFTNTVEITIDNLTFRPIIAQAGKCTYKLLLNILNLYAVKIITSLETGRGFPCFENKTHYYLTKNSYPTM